MIPHFKEGDKLTICLIKKIEESVNRIKFKYMKIKVEENVP